MYKVMKLRVWWPHICCDILKLLEGYVICEKNAAKPEPHKLVLLIVDLDHFKQWALGVLEPISDYKRGKRFLIKAINYATC